MSKCFTLIAAPLLIYSTQASNQATTLEEITVAKDKMPNSSSGSGAGSAKGGTNNGASGGLTMSNDMRADVRKAPSSKNPYPKGLA